MRSLVTEGIDPASYRDPAGFVFRRDGILYRQIDPRFAADWDAFVVGGGLYERLATDGLIVAHETAPLDRALMPGAHAVIQPSEVGFISYPYEWSFGQLKAAALLTLDLQERALDAGMTLRDASAFNIQFERGRPILIDSLSFERAEPGRPWEAYRQFCEHFLGPLALMAYRDVRLGLLLRDFINGVPIDLVSELLPGRTRLRLGMLTHVHLHARAQRRHGNDAGTPDRPVRERRVSELGRRAVLDSLRTTVRRLDWTPSGTEWAEYAGRTSYSEAATRSKRTIVERMLHAAGGTTVWDLGANVGVYSAIAAGMGRSVIAWDVDPAAVERHWRAVSRDGVTNVLPLVLDLANPSPSLGWALEERRSLLERAGADVVMALALVHHLAIGRNLPLRMISALLARLGRDLIVEFVPKEDPMVQHLLATRRDVFAGYSIDGFREAFATDYDVVEEAPIEETSRVLFQMRRRGR